MAEIIYGSEVSNELKEELKEKVTALQEQGKRVPCLAVLLVGNHPASVSYVTSKEKACIQVGMHSHMVHLPEDITQEQLEEEIEKCNKDETIDGILLQLPLPKGLDETHAIMTIDPTKDVDGLHPMNVGRLYCGLDAFVPCTPRGIMELLKRMHCEIAGKRAVVIGRSKLVGAPVARLLQNANATVTIAHRHTNDLAPLCKEADILIAAVGKARFIDHTYIKEGAYVIDVGINHDENGKLCGDVDFDDVVDHVTAITPVPKGVGPMTVCMLLENTFDAYMAREK